MAPFVVAEEIARHGTAVCFIGFDTDEAGKPRMARHMGFGQMPPHRIECRAIVAQRGFDHSEHLPLTLVAVGQSEGHQRIERDRSGPIVIDELRRDRRQLHAFANVCHGYSEPTGDILLTGAPVD
ncbi:hypothetical protein U0C82_17340 [Fulvimarina sp. 2208YS6-2-32]|uniref:Uncharacterized protein n=1 Tax=Fulvimarina uroteuthidis TaxID=3098149 RepID=A0ABU5I709_9HYPH|nr:hypothetical protein [Fulvimarina sp. 2208YS6-2-32]MDY8110905.1 hypothetical protein [Fulvimarina sp. 2208YS6-2-32]